MTDIHTLADLTSYAQKQVERLTRMQQDLAGCVGAGESPGGLFSARTGPGGRLIDLRLGPGVMELSVENVAAGIRARAARHQLDR